MRTSIVLASLAVVVALVANEGQASACGGCFHPPTENPTVVTDHRMVMTVAKGSSTSVSRSCARVDAAADRH